MRSCRGKEEKGQVGMSMEGRQVKIFRHPEGIMSLPGQGGSRNSNIKVPPVHWVSDDGGKNSGQLLGCKLN